MSQRSVSLLCWIMLAVFPLAMFAADTLPAMLTSTGTVTVNGSAIANKSASVYPGDRIATGPQSAVAVSRSGALLLVEENSEVVYGGGQIKMEHGRAMVSSNNLQARLANLTITPTSGAAKYQVDSEGKMMEVAAVVGELRISDGTHTITLPQGHMLRTGASNGPQAPPPTPAAGGSGIPGWVLAVIAAGVGGAAAATALATTGSPHASPSVP